MEAAVVAEKGLRHDMEDAHFLDLDFAGKGWVFGGIYDGHGGKYAAVYASERLHQVFTERLLSGISPQEAFVDSYKGISDELKAQDSGTTAVNFLIQGEELFTANVGDARAIVVGRNAIRQLTFDHRLDNPEERQRIEEMGGEIQYPYACRGYRGLMPTRSIGDEYFKSIGIIATPAVNYYRITPEDKILLAACDGLFDLMTNEEAAAFARKYPQPKSLVETLSREVLVNRGGTDNLTVIAVSLQPK